MSSEIRPWQLRVSRSVSSPETAWSHYIVTDKTTLFYGGTKKKHWRVVDVKSGDSFWRRASSIERDELIAEIDCDPAGAAHVQADHDRDKMEPGGPHPRRHDQESRRTPC